jgi:hypothetical protein
MEKKCYIRDHQTFSITVNSEAKMIGVTEQRQINSGANSVGHWNYPVSAKSSIRPL